MNKYLEYTCWIGALLAGVSLTYLGNYENVKRIGDTVNSRLEKNSVNSDALFASALLAQKDLK